MPESSKVWSENSLGVSGPEVRAASPHIFLVSDTLTPPNTGLITWGNGLTSPVLGFCPGLARYRKDRILVPFRNSLAPCIAYSWPVSFKDSPEQPAQIGPWLGGLLLNWPLERARYID